MECTGSSLHLCARTLPKWSATASSVTATRWSVADLGTAGLAALVVKQEVNPAERGKWALAAKINEEVPMHGIRHGTYPQH